MSSVRDFILSNRPNGNIVWERKVRIYIRKGYHFTGKTPQFTLDLASLNIDVLDRGKGLFTRLVEHCENLIEELDQFKLPMNPLPVRIMGIYVESVLRERFRDKLLRMGFEYVRLPDDATFNYFLPRRIGFSRTSEVEFRPGTCCVLEKRNMNGGCDNCGDPCY